MTKLHELLAVEADKNAVANKLAAESVVTFTKKADMFIGQTRSLNYFAPERQGENVTDTKLVVSTVDENLGYTLDRVADYYDVLLQKERTNQTAVADLVINGVVVAHNLPATFLLGMETRLKALRPLFEAVPTLPPAIPWVSDESAGDGHWRSPVTKQPRTEKKLEYITVAQATDKHPAQVKDWTADVPVGMIESVTFSGMWTVEQKASALARLDELLQAVKKARQRANLVDVAEGDIGTFLTEFITYGTIGATA